MKRKHNSDLSHGKCLMLPWQPNNPSNKKLKKYTGEIVKQLFGHLQKLMV